MAEHDDRLKYAQDFAHAALRGLMVVNGGAIVALFTFIGGTDASFDRSSIWWAFAGFAAGLALTLAAMIIGYFSLGLSWQDRATAANRWENAGITCTVLALLSFVLGAAFALCGVMVA